MLDIQDALQRAGATVLHISSPYQVSCPFHGSDVNKSMRVYPETNSCHCWTCGRSWNPVAVVADTDGIGYYEALTQLKKQYGDSAYVERIGRSEAAELAELFLLALRNERIAQAQVDRLLTQAARGYAASELLRELRAMISEIL